MRETTCDECGQLIQIEAVAGRLPARCQPCGDRYAQRLSDIRGERRRLRRQGIGPDVTASVCVDCGADSSTRPELQWSGRGRPKERCDPCRILHTRRTSSTRSLAWIHANPEKAKEKQRKGYQRNADVIRARSLAAHYQAKYGITIADRDQMLNVQGGKCAICGGGPNGRGRLHVDHCHATNRIRGLLCSNCNTLLGLAADDPARLIAAAEYLTKT